MNRKRLKTWKEGIVASFECIIRYSP